MTQTSMSFDRPSPKDLGFKEGSQNAQLYRMLLERRRVSNIEIIHQAYILNSTGRVSDLRKALKPYLMDVKATPDPHRKGVFYYELKG